MKDTDTIDFYKPVEKTALETLKTRLEHLKEYFDDVYAPLKTVFRINTEDFLDVEIAFELHGEKGWKIGLYLKIPRNYTDMRRFEEGVEGFVKEIRYSMEKRVTKFGIESLNNKSK